MRDRTDVDDDVDVGNSENNSRFVNKKVNRPVQRFYIVESEGKVRVRESEKYTTKGHAREMWQERLRPRWNCGGAFGALVALMGVETERAWAARGAEPEQSVRGEARQLPHVMILPQVSNHNDCQPLYKNNYKRNNN